MPAPAISIGTSGWKFDDWAGTFYPLRVPQTMWLVYYAARFPIGEINSTYYRIAPLAAYAGIARRTPESFRLFAKVHADVTHTREHPGDSLRALRAALQPLTDAGKLLGLLAQFPNRFHFTREAMAYLLHLRELCARERLCVEFRHSSWLEAEALEAVREAGLTWVCPDEPDLPDLMPRRVLATSDMLYVRLHGRNARAWYDRSAGDRYDYLYSEDELQTVGREIAQGLASVTHGYVLFNNCHGGQAPRNALRLINWFTGESGADAGEQGGNGFTLSAD
jgi:uncharacterized protein YecE (DUF72 family)